MRDFTPDENKALEKLLNSLRDQERKLNQQLAEIDAERVRRHSSDFLEFVKYYERNEGMSRVDAIVRAAQENPELYEAYRTSNTGSTMPNSATGSR